MVGFRGTVEQHHHKNTVQLPLKDSDGSAAATIPLDKLVDSIEGLQDKSRFWLAPTLCHGALQTMYIYGAAADQVKFPVYYGRRVVELPQGGVVSADYVIPQPESSESFKKLVGENFPEGWPKLHPRTRYLSPSEVDALKSETETRPLVIINHGLGGGSHEPVIRMLTSELHDAGIDAVVLNSRGCSRTKLTTPELFSGLATEDLRYFTKLIQKEYPKRPLFGVGFSFGATILSNYLGEEAGDSPYVAAAVLSNPWDMVDSAYHIQHQLVGKYLFSDSIAFALSRMVKSNRETLSQSPLFTEEKIHKKYHSTVEFDNAITAPEYGFQTAYQYYRAASSVNRLLKIRTPLLAINSSDDPVVGVYSIPNFEAEANPYVVLIKTDLGGHLAFVQHDGKSWAVERIVDYFKAFDKTVDLTKKVESSYKPMVSKYVDKVHF
ncbi:medium-chain fatty acid ethyl ester synthase/esterase [Cyberlindnera jadinii NRRL Y-1542]|uniref:AB-hydrolase YheT n=1 Tax=Cyberlindnera jadinii (strain ATCC 18201 / CBS 1600 / BCRC 20928 / JCM 3617 / NBRC 0987 / NRRL Y-1542) TaxID=983966 RepID=A0A1E4S5C9_CYBJN|nr:AB-hydrolase YheT [Cyberlindnera jadinii NRRL Y-1542]ODV74714.1 AB-hydrolase YheT [Cyberlindnera jadinii NRRL Y-1542]